MPPDEEGLGWRLQYALSAACVVFLFAAVQLWLVYVGGNLVTVDKDGQGVERAAIHLKLGCFLNVLSKIGLNLTKSLLRKSTAEKLEGNQVLLARRGLLNSSSLTMSCLSTRCCRPMHRDLHRVLDDISNSLLTAAEPDVSAEVMEVLRRLAKEIVHVIEDQASSSGQLVLSRLVNEIALAVLNLEGLPQTAMKEVSKHLPLPVRAVLAGKLERTVTAVWHALDEAFWDVPERRNTSPSTRRATVALAEHTRVGAVLTSLCDDLLDPQVLSTMSGWYWKVLRIYVCWFLGLFVLTVCVAVYATRADYSQESWMFAVGIGTVVFLLAQLGFTAVYLQRRAEKLTKLLLDGVEATLLGLMVRPDLVLLVGDVADLLVPETAKQLWPLDGPIRALYTGALGGRAGVIKIATEQFEAQKPLIEQIFADLQAPPGQKSTDLKQADEEHAAAAASANNGSSTRAQQGKTPTVEVTSTADIEMGAVDEVAEAAEAAEASEGEEGEKGGLATRMARNISSIFTGEMDKHATKLQAAHRGCATRRNISRRQQVYEQAPDVTAPEAAPMAAPEAAPESVRVQREWLQSQEGSSVWAIDRVEAAFDCVEAKIRAVPASRGHRWPPTVEPFVPSAWHRLARLALASALITCLPAAAIRLDTQAAIKLQSVQRGVASRARNTRGKGPAR